jgi:uncharacterized membrane protein YkvA (DUF1232 family)
VDGWWTVLLEVLGGLLVLWLALLLVLWRAAPDQTRLRDALRLLPDLLRLLRRLADDENLPRGVRIRLAALLAYLALPIDLVPDFIPVLGYADDAIITALVLRSVVRSAGPDALTRHWPGTAEGLATIHRLAGLEPRPSCGRRAQDAPSDASPSDAPVAEAGGGGATVSGSTPRSRGARRRIR